MRHCDSRPCLGRQSRRLCTPSGQAGQQVLPHLPTGALPRNQLAASATGSASLISSKQPRFFRRCRRFGCFPLDAPAGGVRLRRTPSPVCGLVNAAQGGWVGVFSPRTRRGENDWNFLICLRQINWGNPDGFPLAPFLLGASPHSPLYLLSFVFSFLSLPLPVLSCRRAGGGLFTEGSCFRG